MLEHIWPTLPTQLRDELITQCVKHLKSAPDESDAFAQLVADITKSRAQTIKSQWRLANIYGTKLAIAREPQKASPFFAQAFMSMRKDEVAALYHALGAAHKDLAVEESSAVTSPPTQAQFASVLTNGLAGLAPEIAQCMIAVIADAGIDSWQGPARAALEAHLTAQTAAQTAKQPTTRATP
ncbi:MAG: hypothetical protein EXS17_08175 [Phycisphaerales bacterium]|nr:hypothetical protein [Phycisphaerales bacterium]